MNINFQIPSLAGFWLGQVSQFSAGQGVAEETERAVSKYSERVPQVTTQHSTKNHGSAVSPANRQVMVVRGLR